MVARPSRRSPSGRRLLAVGLVALLLGAEVARLTAAGALAETRTELARKLAPQHPQVLVSSAMADVGRAAAVGEAPAEAAMDRLRRLMVVAPLEPEPLLVQAAVAQRAGDGARSERLLLQARRRHPRSPAARYLLADIWLKGGRIEEGLSEVAVLSRLLPGSPAQLAPALTQYANTPGATSRLKRLIEANPDLGEPLLNALAADPDNSALILDIERSVRSQTKDGPPPWRRILLNGLVRRGEYERAYQLWQRLSGVTGGRPLLFSGDFRTRAAPPPFNWDFISTGAGVAEPAGGRLRVLYYGREDARLAWQLLMLPPGTYRLSSPVSGSTTPGALAWTLHCLPGRRPLAQLDLSSSPAQARFQVPASCEAQSLELTGRLQDAPSDSNLLVGPVALERVAQ